MSQRHEDVFSVATIFHQLPVVLVEVVAPKLDAQRADHGDRQHHVGSQRLDQAAELGGRLWPLEHEVVARVPVG